MRFKSVLVAGLMAAGMGLAACTASVEDEGRAPDVDVDPGAMPNVDVDPANVDVSADTQQVVVPDVDVTADTAADTTQM